MDPIIEFLKGIQPDDQSEIKKLQRKAAHYLLQGEKLYKRGYSLPLLKCLTPDEADYVIREVHEGICGDHVGARTLMRKIVRQGYYWPSISKYAKTFVRKCDKCQRYVDLIKHLPKNLMPISSPWPFAQWGIDLIGPIPTRKGQVRFAIVAVDYFTKWAEAEPLATTTEAKVRNFVWRNLICRFRIPHVIITITGNSSTMRNLIISVQISE